MNKIIIAVALLLGSHTVMAKWVMYGASDDQKSYFKDDSIRKKADRVKVWILLDFPNGETLPGGREQMSSKHQVEFDCYNETSRLLYSSSMSGSFGKGDIIWSSNDSDSEFAPVIPDTIHEILFKRVCTK